MSVPKKETKGEKFTRQVVDSLKEKADEFITDLLGKYGVQVVTQAENAENGKARINFGVELDTSESEYSVKVSSSFSSTISDSRNGMLDLPNQPKLPLDHDKIKDESNSASKKEEADRAAKKKELADKARESKAKKKAAKKKAAKKTAKKKAARSAPKGPSAK